MRCAERIQTEREISQSHGMLTRQMFAGELMMSSITKRTWITTIAVAGLAINAAHAQSKTSNTSTTSVKKSVGQQILDNTSVSYFGFFIGAPVSDPFSSKTPAVGKQYYTDGSEIGLENQLTVSYKINPTLSASLNPVFKISPSATRYGMIASFARLASSSVYNKGNFNVGADLRFYPGITNDMQRNHERMTWRSDQDFSYKVPSSRLTAGVTTSLRYHNYLVDSPVKDYRIKAIPNVQYQIANNLSAGLAYEMALTHIRNTAGVPAGTVEEYQEWTFLEPSITWNITENVMFNPYVDLYTGDKVTGETAQLGAVFMWKMM